MNTHLRRVGLDPRLEMAFQRIEIWGVRPREVSGPGQDHEVAVPAEFPDPLDIPEALIRAQVDLPPLHRRPRSIGVDQRVPGRRIPEIQRSTEQLDPTLDDAIGRGNRP